MPGADCMYNVVIIGSGCAGLTAAIYAARANLNPLVLDGHEPGGQLSLTTHVENFPGFPEGILGPELIEKMREQAKKFGTEFRAGTVTEVDLTRRPFRISAGKDVYEAETLIVASGASARLLGLKGERELIGRGLSTCATCDGYFFRGKAIAVVGGGDTAMEEANFLSRYASHVYLIHRRDEFRASKIMIDRAKANPKVEFLIPYVVDEVLTSDNLVNGVRIRNTTSGEMRDLELHGVFVAIGHDPNSTIFRGKVDMDQNGYLVSKNGTTTNVPGVFIAGDVQDPRYRQAVTAAASGCMAALDAEKFLEEHKNLVATGLSGELGA
jgi:thioredoxin reductase (NADPH)